MKNFADKISEAIKQSKYSQKEIAKILDLSESNISNWKKGENLPSLDVFYRLCILLNESADYLLDINDYYATQTKQYNIEDNHGNISFS